MNDDAELRAAVESWRTSILRNDVAAAAALRADDYTLTAGNRTMSKAEELALMAKYPMTSVRIDGLRFTTSGTKATATFTCSFEGEGLPSKQEMTIDFERRDSRWLLVRSIATPSKPPGVPLRRRLLGAIQRRLPRRPELEELAFVPYKPGQDFVLPRAAPRAPGEKLPIPPRKLWLDYDYPAHGKEHVDTMLAIAAASGFELQTGDRVLDFGCGAGRLIRHFEPFADRCEIWGTDISSEHILWCKRNLSPPFHFATTTKIPHLPFEDRSFRLIYAGSVFTHIDDLADAWLLELHRILAPDGRLYVTIHDEHTIQLIKQGRAEWLRPFVENRLHEPFDLLVAERGPNVQVFHARDYFLRMMSSAFEVLSVTPEAYFYQTAVLAKRK